MNIDWRKVAQSLNARAMNELEFAITCEDAEASRDFRNRASIIMAIAEAIFDGLESGDKAGVR